MHIYLSHLEAGTETLRARMDITSWRKTQAEWDPLTTSRFKIYKFSQFTGRIVKKKVALFLLRLLFL